jgi:hypothetical protein
MMLLLLMMIMTMMKYVQNLDWKNKEGIAYLRIPDVDGKTTLDWTYDCNRIMWTEFV